MNTAWPLYMFKVGGLPPSHSLLIIVRYLAHPSRLCVKCLSFFYLVDGHPWTLLVPKHIS
jgi:hypothetical protein